MFSQTAAAITVLSGLFTFVIGQQPEYAQCGGIGWTGSTVCASPYVCTYENDYYYQCLPGTGGTTTTTKTTTTSVSTKTTTTTSKTTTTASHTTTASSAQCTVNSVSSASSLSSCSSVVIQGFTVPAGSTVTIAAASGASITMAGNVVFAQTTTSGPLFTLNTNNVNFNGNGYHFDGQGALYWDGEGTGGGVTKPHPLIKLKGYGTFADFTVLNSPAHAISVGTSSTTTIQSVTVDDSAGASQGANTDGFDIGASDLTLLNNVVKNQDDCIAINSGSNILIQGMSCDGGHGLSIGSIDSGDTVSNVRFISNTITNSQNGLRIKVDASADSTAKVSGVTYTSNKVSGISKYGVLITQSYPDSYSTPGTSSTISGISFTGGTTTVSVTSAAYGLAIDCGHCTGTWDLSGLDVTAVGKGHELTLGGGVTLSGGTY